MSWLFSQALVEEYSPTTFAATEPSAQLNVMPTQQPFWRNDKTMDHSRFSRFGLTSTLLTEDHGAALLTSFQADFLARTSAQREAEKASTASDPAYGRRMGRIIGEVRPQFVRVENSPLLVGRGLAVVLGDLAAMGFDAQWGCLSASELGAPHDRNRAWVVGRNVADAFGSDGERLVRERTDARGWPLPASQPAGLLGGTRWQEWPTEPGVHRVGHGLAHRVDRCRALGNGQVPRVAAAAWRILTEAA